MPRPSEVSLGDMRRALARLSPFLGVVGAAVLLVAVPSTGGSSSLAASGGSAKHFQLPAPIGGADASAAAAAAPAASPPQASPLTDSAAVTAVASPPPATLAAPPPSAYPASAAPAVATPTDTSSPDASAAPTDTPETPLAIGDRGWASREAGTPLASTDVPDGTLPVANRAGQADKASFVRLSGTATTLTLSADPSGARNLAGAGAVQACPITASWTPAPAMSFDQAPAYDATKCVAGTASPDGSTWSFNLSGFADRAGGNGFALVPAPSAPVDFQVAFKVA